MTFAKTSILAASLLLSTTADAKGMGEKVTAEVTGITNVQISLTQARFIVITELTRKKFPPMVLTGLRYDVLMAGQKIGEGTIEDNQRLKRNQAVRVEIPTRLSLSAGLMALMAGDAELTISGEVSGRWLFFTQERTFEQTISMDEITSTLSQ